MDSQIEITAVLIGSDVKADPPPDATCVVVDQLRATSTITAAIAAGARAVWPCLEPDEARRRAAALGPNGVLGGERHAVRLEGFDLGNSPREYTTESVGNREVVTTTTNGTRAIRWAAGARRVLIGCLANRGAVAARMAESPHVLLVGAGVGGGVAFEDTLTLGAIIDAALERGVSARLDDAALIAWRSWRGLAGHDAASLFDAQSQASGGRALLESFSDDIRWCSRVDVLDVVPELDPRTGAIVRGSDD